MILNPAARVRTENVQGIPILYIDDFYADPDSVRQQALNANYHLAIAYYPGRHAPLDGSIAGQLLRNLATILTAVGDRRYSADAMTTDFSIVTTLPENLLPTQQHPHIDTQDALGLVYLTPGSDEGTCLYFNEVLGISVVRTADERSAYETFLREHAKTPFAGGYAFDQHPAWRKIHTIEPVFNRFVFYPGNVFHSIDIKRISRVVDMQTVRVTQRVIIQRTFSK